MASVNAFNGKVKGVQLATARVMYSAGDCTSPLLEQEPTS